MKRAYGVLPWAIVLLGLVHMAATWRYYHALTPAALWFFNGGIVLAFTGALNLVNRRDGSRAPALRWLCRAANVITLAFATVAGIVGGASALQLLLVLGVLGAVTVLSLLPGVSEASP